MSRKILMRVMSGTFAMLTAAQAIPWFNYYYDGSNRDANDGLTWIIPAAVIAAIVLFFCFRPSWKTLWRYALAVVGVALASQGIGALVGSFIAGLRGGTRETMGVEFAFIFLPFAMFGTTMAVVAVSGME
jgi:urea transporter